MEFDGASQGNDPNRQADCAGFVSQLEETLLKLFSAKEYTPPLLPKVALELLELSRRNEASARSISDLLSKDAILAARVLRIAESPVYSAGRPIRSLDEAIMRLGLRRVSDLFMRAAVEMRIFRAAGYEEPMQRLAKHSAFTAEMARKVSRATTGFDDFAFLCGLLHDVGAAAVAIAVTDADRTPSRPSFEQVWQCAAANHARFGQRIAELWQLPSDIALVIGMHHAPSDGKHIHPLAAAIALADCLAEETEHGFQHEADPILTGQLATQLGLSRVQLDDLRQTAQHLTSC
ncbi:MAG TPA: HDOD domain-containing protein [Polyangiaceae bacterium]|nr:HDOD domain-containing protein [Polyangiaceae bacterium]